MTIRFSCDCGAQFEVSDDMAGLRGRCRNCGREMTIPHTSTLIEDDAADSDESLSENANSRSMGSVSEEPLPETSRTRYCPYCGHQIDEPAVFCPRCRKALLPPSDVQHDVPFTPIDWTLVTVLAPVGFVLGFVSLVTGNRKGLNMIGISTASMFVYWLVSVILGWIR